MSKKYSLGRGLGKLLEEQSSKVSRPSDIFFNDNKNSKLKNNNEKIAKYIEVKIDDLEPNPNQPRKAFSESEIKELSDSIKEVGLLQPIIIRKSDKKNNKKPYQIIMGERRFRAAKKANFKKLPAIIKETNDNEMLRNAILENIHRVQLNPIEEAASFKQIINDFGVTHLEIAKKLSKSRVYITNTLRILNLPTKTQKLLIDGKLTQGHAKALLQLNDNFSIDFLSEKIVHNNLSVHSTEKLARLKSISEISLALKKSDNTVKKFVTKKIKKGYKSSELIEIENELSDKFDTVVKIDLGAKKGSIKIDFSSIDDLNRIIKKFK